MRRREGVAPLTYLFSLEAAARAHALATWPGHGVFRSIGGLDGSGVLATARAQGYQLVLCR